MIREMRSSDGVKVLEIYQMGIETRNATFETAVPTWEEWNSKHLQHSRFVYESERVITGWAAVSAVSQRFVYRGVAEVSIYVDGNQAGKGIGSALMAELISSSEKNGIWTLQSSVFPENKATLRLHEKFGFRIIGKRERIACLDGVWRDTFILECRSNVVGV